MHELKIAAINRTGKQRAFQFLIALKIKDRVSPGHAAKISESGWDVELGNFITA